MRGCAHLYSSAHINERTLTVSAQKRRLFVKHRKDAVILEERDASRREALSEIAVYEISLKII